MSESPKRPLRVRDVVIILGVAIAFLVIVGILQQGFFAVD